MQSILSMNSYDFKYLLKHQSRLDFIDTQGPDSAQFSLVAHDIENLENLCIQWCIKTNSGILLVSEPITRWDYYNFSQEVLSDPDDLDKQILDEFKYYLESLEQAAYVASGRYNVNIKLEHGNEPRFYIFLNNSRSADDFINAIHAMDYLLPQLMNSLI